MPRPVVDDFSLTVPAGEVFVLVGPSGCGKSTAMKIVNRLVEPTAGEIRIDGVSARDREPAKLHREIGYVIQQVGLMPQLTAAVARNVSADRPGRVRQGRACGRRSRLPGGEGRALAE